MQGKYSAAGRLTRLGACALAVLLIAGGGFFSSSCTKRPAPGRPPVQGAQKPTAGGNPAPSRISPAMGQAQQSPKPQAPLAASIRAFGLGSSSTPRIAWDYSLGPLQSLAPPSGDAAEVLRVARAFMDGQGSGKLDPELLLPSSREALKVLLAPRPAAGGGAAASYRLGAIRIQGDGASLRLRLPQGGAGAGKGLDDPASRREEGILSLRKAEGSWYVEALALDPPKTGALVFDPASLARIADGD